MKRQIAAVMLAAALANTFLCGSDLPEESYIAQRVTAAEQGGRRVEITEYPYDYSGMDPAVVRPYVLTANEYYEMLEEYTPEEMQGLGGNQEATLTWVAPGRVRVDVYEMEPYRREDILALKKGSEIFIQGGIMKIDYTETSDNSVVLYSVVEEDPEAETKPAGSPPEMDENGFYKGESRDLAGNKLPDIDKRIILTAYNGPGSDFVEQDSSLVYRLVKTAELELSEDFFFLTGRTGLGREEFEEALRSHPENFTYQVCSVEILENQVCTVISDAYMEEAEPDAVTLEMPERPYVEGALNPVYLTIDEMEVGAPMKTTIFGNYSAALHYLDDETVQAELYGHTFYPAEMIENLQPGDRIVLQGEVKEVRDTLKVDFGTFRSIDVLTTERQEYDLRDRLAGYYEDITDEIPMSGWNEKLLVTLDLPLAENVRVTLVDNDLNETDLTKQEFLTKLQEEPEFFNNVHTTVNIGNGKIQNVTVMVW